MLVTYDGVPKGRSIGNNSHLTDVDLSAQCWNNANEPEDCLPQHEDYFECLHRKKEVRQCYLFAKPSLTFGPFCSRALR